MNIGEVVTGTEERLATGGAVNVAARPERAARPGEVLVAEGTLRLARAVEPETSQKKTVTVFRISRTGAASASGVPQGVARRRALAARASTGRADDHRVRV